MAITSKVIIADEKKKGQQDRQLERKGGEKMSEKAITGYTKIVVETDEENPVTIATVDADNIEVTGGYRVRLTLELD